MDNSAKRLYECKWSLGLKDIPPQVDTCATVAGSAMSHRQSVQFGNFLTPHWLGYLLNGQLQGKHLSAYKISQASPGTPDLRFEGVDAFRVFANSPHSARPAARPSVHPSNNRSRKDNTNETQRDQNFRFKLCLRAKNILHPLPTKRSARLSAF